MFGRKKSKRESDGDVLEPSVEESAEPAEPAEPASEPQGAAFDRSDGPFDAEEVADRSAYASFGALHVPAREGVSVRIEADPSTGQLVAMTIVLGAGAVQVRALAAPRSGGVWDRNREALQTQITGSGGRANQTDGPFGVELMTMVPVPEGQPGGPGLRPMRFVGVEGPRWMLHGAFMGAGADPAAWDDINALFRQLIVVRGEEAMPVGALLTLRAPEQAAPPAAPQDADEPTLETLEPRDRITEVR